MLFKVLIQETRQTLHQVLGQIIRKNGPRQYEVIPYERYRESLKYEQTWDFKPLRR